MKRILLLVLVVSAVVQVFAQKKQAVTDLYTVPSVRLIKPLLIDSVNRKGEKLTDENLLKMNLRIPDQDQFIQHLVADTGGYFAPAKPAKDAELHLYSFYISGDRYGKAKLKVKSTNRLEIFVDGKSVTTKKTAEDSLRLAKEVSTDITPYPEPVRVVVKLLAKSDDKADPRLKIELENQKSDSLTQFTFRNTDRRPYTFSDVVQGKRVMNSRISPRSGYALLLMAHSSGEKQQRFELLYNLRTGRTITLSMPANRTQLNWMPRSEKLYVVQKNEDDTHDLITIDPETLQETVLISNAPALSEYVRLAPDEQSFFYNKRIKADEGKSDLKLLEAIDDRLPGYRDYSLIHRYDLRTGLDQQLTFARSSTSLNDISFDSKRIIFTTSIETPTKRPFRAYSAYILNLETMAIDTLWTDEGFASSARFSPDAKQILISGAPEAFDGIGLNIAAGQIANSYDRQVYIMDLATKKIDPISKNFDPSIEASYWHAKDGLIYLRTTDRDYSRVHTYDTKTKKFAQLPLSEDVVRAFSFPTDGSTVVYVGSSVAHSTRAYTYDLRTKKEKLIMQPNKEREDKFELGKYGDWNFTNTAGTQIDGRYYLPPNMDAGKQYPMIVYYYGGTTPTSRSYELNYPPHYYAAMGYVVYVVQPSGAIGYGQQFSAMHVNAWGIRTADDIIEGTKKFMSEHPFVNPKKVGCIGASYGGFMTMYLQTRTDIFAAAVSHAGISALSSYWGEGYWGYSYSSGASAHSYPWNNQDLYVKQSPLFSADKVKTPILFTHGLEDTNVPPGESIQMHTALRILGTPTALILVKKENHGIADYKHRVEWMNSIMAWFGKWLKDDDGWWKAMYPNGTEGKKE